MREVKSPKEKEKSKENDEMEVGDKKVCLCLPSQVKYGVEYEDGVRMFWNATRTINCKVKAALLSVVKKLLTPTCHLY